MLQCNKMDREIRFVVEFKCIRVGSFKRVWRKGAKKNRENTKTTE